MRWPSTHSKPMYEMLSTFDRVGLRDLIRGSSRRAGRGLGAEVHAEEGRSVGPRAPGTSGNGSFMQAANAGEQADGTSSTRAFNVWVSLTPCGEEAPGLDIVPRRLEHLRSPPAPRAPTAPRRGTSDAIAPGRAAGEAGHHPAALRARRRAPLRCAVPAPDWLGTLGCRTPVSQSRAGSSEASAFPEGYTFPAGRLSGGRFGLRSVVAAADGGGGRTSRASAAAAGRAARGGAPSGPGR